METAMTKLVTVYDLEYKQTTNRALGYKQVNWVATGTFATHEDAMKYARPGDRVTPYQVPEDVADNLLSQNWIASHDH